MALLRSETTQSNHAPIMLLRFLHGNALVKFPTNNWGYVMRELLGQRKSGRSGRSGRAAELIGALRKDAL
eukprot:9261153-Pyramimonas_sp.AAC.1